jgi:predicted GIY-YIG superfamily endonuclease
MAIYHIASVLKTRYIAAIKLELERLKYHKIDMLNQPYVDAFGAWDILPEKGIKIVYFIKIGNDIRYIGMTENIRQRIAQHKDKWLTIETANYRNAYSNNCAAKVYFYTVKPDEDIRELEKEMIRKYMPARNNKSSTEYIPIGNNKGEISQRLQVKISKANEQKLKDLDNPDLLKVMQINIPENPDNRNILKQIWECIFQFYMYSKCLKTPNVNIAKYSNSAKKGIYFEFSYRQFIEVFDIKQNACDWFVSQLIFLNYIEPPIEYTSAFPNINYYKFTKHFMDLCETIQL